MEVVKRIVFQSALNDRKDGKITEVQMKICPSTVSLFVDYGLTI